MIIPFDMDKNNLKHLSVLLVKTYKDIRPTTNFLFPKLSMCYYNKTTFWGVGIFFAFKSAKGEFRSTHVTLQLKPSLNNWLGGGGLAQNILQTDLQTYVWWAFFKEYDYL